MAILTSDISGNPVCFQRVHVIRVYGNVSSHKIWCQSLLSGTFTGCASPSVHVAPERAVSGSIRSYDLVPAGSRLVHLVALFRCHFWAVRCVFAGSRRPRGRCSSLGAMTLATRRREYDYAWQVLRRWGQRSATKARFRSVAPLFTQLPSTAHLLDRWAALAFPWCDKPWMYPGKIAVLRCLCGIRSRSSFTAWRQKGIPPAQCERLARFLESRVERELAMVAELRAYAADAEARKRPNYFSRDLTIDERYRIAAGKRAKREARKRLRRSVDDLASGSGG
jgi:hypothetical protein